jgi:hypothetical protein
VRERKWVFAFRERRRSARHRKIKGVAVDSTVLSLIPLAGVAITIIIGFGAGFLATIAPRQKIAITSAERREIPPDPALSPHESTPLQHTDQTRSPRSVALVSPAYETNSSPETILKAPTEQNGLIEATPRNLTSDAMAAPENAQPQNERSARIRFLRRQEARVERQLSNLDLSPAERRTLERRKAYLNRALKRTLTGP